MEEMSKEVISNLIDLANKMMGFIDLYEPNRPGSIATQKLEEAVMWCQVMCSQNKLKSEVIQEVEKDKIEDAQIIEEKSAEIVSSL